jgi:hypothetical protein
MHSVRPKALGPRAYHERKARQEQSRSLNSVFNSYSNTNAHTNSNQHVAPAFQIAKKIEPTQIFWFSRLIKSIRQFLFQSSVTPVEKNNQKQVTLAHQTVLILDSQTVFKDNVVHSNSQIKPIETIIEQAGLPSELQAQVQEIHLLYEHIDKHGDLDVIERHNATRLVQEKLPQYIADFLAMKKEYRTSLVNAQGKNAYELFSQSLANICSHLQQIEMQSNESRLKELSVAARYTEAQLELKSDTA